MTKYSFKPLSIFLLYVYFTLFVSVFGPIRYENYNSTLVIIYVSIFLIFFSMAYYYGIKKRKPYKIHQYNGHHYKLALKIVKWSIVATALYSLSIFINYFLKGGSINLYGAGQAYLDTYTDYVRGSGNYSVSFVVSILFKVPYLISLVLGVYYFKRLKTRHKYMVVFIVLVELVVNTLGSGKNKHLGDIIIYLSAILLIKQYSGNLKITKKYTLYIIMIGFLGVLSILYLFYLRYEAIGINVENINNKAHPLMTFYLDNIILNSDIGLPIAILSGYLSQGWYGLSLAFQLPFEWTYFFGNSYSMMIIYEKYLGGDSLLATSYPYRVGSEFGWDESKWHSWFTWFASDFSFIGVLFLAFPMGYIYAVSWKESIIYSNPMSVFMFALLSLGLVFLPANNQLLHTPQGVLTFFVAISLWLFARKKFNFEKSY